MSVARDIEGALKAAMSESMTAIPRLWIRTSRDQSKALPDNGLAGGVAFPQIYIAASPKYYTNAHATWASDISITLATHIDDDPAGWMLADIEDAAEAFFDTFTACSANPAFEALMRESRPSWNYGGFLSESTGTAPEARDEMRTLTLNFTLHFSLD